MQVENIENAEMAQHTEIDGAKSNIYNSSSADSIDSVGGKGNDAIDKQPEVRHS